MSAMNTLPLQPAASPTTLSGGCQCGDVRYTLSGAPLLTAICHCSMCRRANAAPCVAWAMYREDQVAFTHTKPAQYPSSSEGKRGFCPRCGTQISFVADYIPGLVDVTIGSLDDPDALPPGFHYWYSRHLDWLAVADSLPKYPEFPPQDGAS